MIRWNKTTWYSRLATIVVLLVAVPVLAFYIGKNYQQEINAVNEGAMEETENGWITFSDMDYDETTADEVVLAQGVFDGFNVADLATYQNDGQKIMYRKDLGSPLPLDMKIDYGECVYEADYQNCFPLISTKLEKGGETYYVVYTPGPSGDPYFIYLKKEGAAYVEVGGTPVNATIPGNGFIYTVSGANRNHVSYGKFSLRGGEIREVIQPFSYAGFKTKTLATVSLVDDRGSVVAKLATSTPVEVVLSQEVPFEDNNNDYLTRFLIKTPSNIVGWYILAGDEVFRPGRYPSCNLEEIEGLCFKGD
jgi:hypothetical protein